MGKNCGEKYGEKSLQDASDFARIKNVARARMVITIG
jgi:hypothetical protein